LRAVFLYSSICNVGWQRQGLEMPRGTLGVRSHVIQPRVGLQVKISSHPAILGLVLLFSFGHFDIVLVLVCTYQLRVRPLLCSKPTTLTVSRLLQWHFTQARQLILS
jgi:hypothetical protein